MLTTPQPLSFPRSLARSLARSVGRARSFRVFCFASRQQGGEDKGEKESSNASPTKLGAKDFELLNVLGQGAFGKVFQVKLKQTKEIYAMKVLKKSQILEKDHIDYMRVEREILTSVSHPFIVTLYNTFQTSSKLYMVMEFINGGHLFFQLYDQGLFSEDVARFFAAGQSLSHSLSLFLSFPSRQNPGVCC